MPRKPTTSKTTQTLPESRRNYVPSGPSQHPRPSCTPNRPHNQYSPCPSYRSHINQRDSMGYPYPQDATSTSPSRRPPFSSADQTDSKYQARRTNIPGQRNNYSNLIQNHPLQDQQCIHSSINADHIHNTYTPPIHTSNTYHSSSHLTVYTNPPYHKINTEPVTIPAKVNTMITNPSTLSRSRNSLFKLSKQHFGNQPVESTPVIIKTENDNLPVHFINHSDHDVVVPKHTYVGVMENVQESDRDNLVTNATPEPVSQHVLSECLAHSDLLPSQGQSMHTPLQENPGVLGSSIANLSSIPLVQHYTDTANAKPIKQGLNFLKLTKSGVDFETNTIETGSTLYPANTHYMPSSNSTIIIPKSDVFRSCRMLLSKKACWMFALMLTIVIILTAVASYTHCP